MLANTSDLKFEKFKINKEFEKKEPFDTSVDPKHPGKDTYREEKFEHCKKFSKYTKTPFCNFAAGQEPI